MKNSIKNSIKNLGLKNYKKSAIVILIFLLSSCEDSMLAPSVDNPNNPKPPKTISTAIENPNNPTRPK